MSQSEDICGKCGKPNQEGFSGSLTQWVALCKCNLLGSEETSDATIYVCLKCAKRIKRGRAGTFTQWIFSSDVCECSEPEPVERAASEFESQFEMGSVDLSSVAEIAVDSDKFPLERFAPIEVISSTSNSTLYLSVDRLLGNTVAIKIIALHHPEDIVDFQSEVKALGSLSHPGLVKVFDFAEKSGAPYMVMEYVDGLSLREYLNQRHFLSVEDTLFILLSLCDTLRYCHSKRVLHRDIKPENILIESINEGLRVKLVDFGIAFTADTIFERGDTIAGTPLYMAPDSGRGRKYAVSSEIYSLGCVAFELLSGSPPFVDESPLKLLKLHAESEIPSLSQKSKQPIQPLLEQIVTRCLAKDPENRFQSVQDLQSAIRELDSTVDSNQDEAEGLPERSDMTADESPGQKVEKNTFLLNKPLIAITFALIVFGSVAYAVIYFISVRDSKKTEDSIEHYQQTILDNSNPYEYLDPEDNLPHQLAVVDKSTKNLYFTGKGLTDKQLRELTKKGPNVDQFHLYGCDSVTGKGLQYYFSRVKPAQVTFSAESSGGQYMRALAKNEKLKFLTLREIESRSLEALPKSLDSLLSITVKLSRVSSADTADLYKIKNLNRLLFISCILEKGSLANLSKTDLSIIELAACTVYASDLTGLKDLNHLKSLKLMNSTFIDDKNSPAVKDLAKVISILKDTRVDNLYLGRYFIPNSRLLELSRFEKAKSISLGFCTFQAGADVYLKRLKANRKVEFQIIN